MGLSSTNTARKAHKKSTPTASGLAKPQKPRGPKTAYNYFYEEERKKILEEDDPAKAIAPSKHHKIIGQKWRRIGKGELLKKYQELAEEDNKRYEGENKEYKRALQLFKDEEEKAQKRRREEEEKAASLVRESIQAYGEREGRLGGSVLAGAQPMGAGLPGLPGGYLGSAMGQAGPQPGWGAPAPGMHSLAPAVAGQMAGKVDDSNRPQVTELVQRLRKQRAALEETTDALLEASSHEIAAAGYPNLPPSHNAMGVPMASAPGSLLSSAGYGMLNRPTTDSSIMNSLQQMQQPSLLQQQKQHLINQQLNQQNPGLAALPGMPSVGMPATGLASSGQANAILAKSMGQQMGGTSGSAASRQQAYSGLMASMQNPTNKG